MADHSEYKIRKNRLDTDPAFKNFKEGRWISPNKTKVLEVVASYEATSINVNEPGSNFHVSISPMAWDMMFSEWTYLGFPSGAW